MNTHVKTILILLTFLAGCQPAKEVKTTGSIERLDPSLDALIAPDAKIEVLAEGFKWSEGPVWAAKEKMLLFSDVPKNKIYKWTEEKGLEVYLTPSGYTGTDSTDRNEPGSNGLVIDKEGRLIVCQHGDRRVGIMDAPLSDPKPVFKTWASNYHGKKFDSPNDAVVDNKGNLFLTDPPYGLSKQDQDPAKEAPYQGVYKVTPDGGKVYLLVDTLTRPNGIALSPDEKYLFVANSDGKRARWYRFELGDTSVVSGKIFYEITQHDPELKGGPDGMKIDKNGNLFASGPGGIIVINPDGKLIGRIKLSEPTANCAFDDDQKTLYITSNMNLLRVKLK